MSWQSAPNDSVHFLSPVQRIIVDDPIINETVLSQDNILCHVRVSTQICFRKLSVSVEITNSKTFFD
jgi:hypothetical protein